MKKLCYCFIVLFLGLFLIVRSPVPARADAWVLPFNKLNDILDMAQTLFSGGKLEFSQVINLTNPLDDVLAVWEDFKDRLAHSQTNEQAQFVWNSLIDLANIGQSVIDGNTNLYIPITYNDVAAFTMYDAYWYAQNIFDDLDQPNPSPDIQFETFIDKMNGTGFWFKDFPNKQGNTSYQGLYYYPPNSVTWCVYQGNAFDFGTCYPYCIPLYTINITSSSGVYSFSTNISSSDLLSQFGVNGNYFYKQGVLYHDGFNYNGNYPNIWNTSFSGTLGQCLDLIAQHFRNVNVYVDGVLWAYAGTIVGPPITAPDVIQVGNTGESTYDVYGLEMPDDLGLDIPNFIDWILNKLSEGATTISLDDAIADEVPLVRTVDGDRAITYEDTRPIWKVIERDIDIPADDPSPIPSPSPTPDIGDPPILKLPTFNYLPHNSETTVLSELIDATQQTIPDDLMNLIWNCFGLLVVGGLIYILHK